MNSIAISRLLSFAVFFGTLPSPSRAQNADAISGVYYYSVPCAVHRLSLMPNGAALRTIKGRSGETRFVGNWWLQHDTVFLHEGFLYRSPSDGECISDTTRFKSYGPGIIWQIRGQWRMPFTKEKPKPKK